MIRLADVQAASDLLRGRMTATPCARSATLSEITGAEVFLKFENLQFTASFKERGALVKLLSLSSEARAHGVVAMSAGNHAQAVAYHARALGISASIVMPRYTPGTKVEHTRRFGAEVVIAGESLAEAALRAEELRSERGLTFIHPYDDDDVIRGQGTVALEMLAAEPSLEMLVVPVGGGGLIAGCAVAARGVKPGLEVVGVEAERFPSMRQALRGQPVECGRLTLAEGIAVERPGQRPLEIIREHVGEILLVGEDEIERAVLLLLEVEKTVVEGAGAVGLAALLKHRERFAGRRVGLVLSGGNIDLLVLSTIIERGLERSARLLRIVIRVPDVPGALLAVMRRLAEAEANIIQVRHRRAFTNVSLREAEVEFLLQLRGRDHARDLVDLLEASDFVVDLPDGQLAPRGRGVVAPTSSRPPGG